MAEIKVPACPIPIQNTKLVMSQAHPTGWFNPHVPITPVLDALTRPFYAIFRRFIPPIGNVDLSPLFVLVLAQIALILLDNLAPLVARLVQTPV